MFVFDSVDCHVNISSSSPFIIQTRPRSSAFFPFQSRPPPRPPYVPPPPPLPCTTTFSDPTATDDCGIIYTVELEVIAEAEVQAWIDTDDDNNNDDDKKE